MLKTVFVVALIRNVVGDSTRWLTIRESGSETWDFLVCHRLGNESLQELLQREVSWRLDIRRSDFLVAGTAQLHVNPMSAASNPDEGDEVELIFNSVDLYKSATLTQLENNSNFRWLSAQELCTGRTNDGQLINRRIPNWLNRWHVIQPWE